MKEDDNIFGDYHYYDPDYDGVDYDDLHTTQAVGYLLIHTYKTATLL